MVTNEANVIALYSVIESTLDTLTVVGVSDSEGEYYRKAPANIEIISPQKKHFTFWFNENEGNGDIIKISIHGDGATEELETGTEMVFEDVVIPKTNQDSLTIEWTVEVKQ